MNYYAPKIMRIFKTHTRFFHIILYFFVLGLFGACTDNSNSYTPSTYDYHLQGTIKSNVHDYSVVGAPLFLTVSGVTNVPDDQVSYSWIIKDTATTYVWGQTIRYVPTVKNITVTFSQEANAYDASGLNAAKTTIVIDSTFSKAVQLPATTETSSTFTDDRDNQTYQYRTIGSYDWMTQNLSWKGQDTDNPVGKSYKNESEYDVLYGRLYTWVEAAENQVCPQGWRLPTNAEWEDLGQVLSGSPVTFETNWAKAGSNATVEGTVNGTKMWVYNPDNTKANTQGWNALPGGKVLATGGSSINSNDNGRNGYWWSATEYNTSTAFIRYIMYNNSPFYYSHGDKVGQYLSVRCVRDATP